MVDRCEDCSVVRKWAATVASDPQFSYCPATPKCDQVPGAPPTGSSANSPQVLYKCVELSSPEYAHIRALKRQRPQPAFVLLSRRPLLKHPSPGLAKGGFRCQRPAQSYGANSCPLMLPNSRSSHPIGGDSPTHPCAVSAPGASSPHQHVHARCRRSLCRYEQGSQRTTAYRTLVSHSPIVRNGGWTRRRGAVRGLRVTLCRIKNPGHLPAFLPSSPSFTAP